MAREQIRQIWHGKGFLSTREHEILRTGYLLGAAWLINATGGTEMYELTEEGEKALQQMLVVTGKILADEPVRYDDIAEALDMAIEIDMPAFKELMEECAE